MKEKRETRAPGRRLVLGLLAAGATLAGPRVFGQPFESVFGPDLLDEGARRVTPVRYCPGGGLVAAGTTGRDDGGTDVYAVRTMTDGTAIWERRYDTGLGGFERGQALAEARDGSGFVIAGSARYESGLEDVLLLKVGCDGEPVWAKTYGSPEADLGLDVVEAQWGTPAAGTRPGDILVAGVTISGGRSYDGLILRTAADGSLIWDRSYGWSYADEIFRAVTETLPRGGATTGDVVAAGDFSMPDLLRDAYAMRVNGDDGLLGAPPQGGAVLRGGTFESVAELRNPSAGLVGSLVFTGSTTAAGSPPDIFLVRTGASPSAVLAARRIGDGAGDGAGEQVALDVREVRYALASARPGQLALTGRAVAPGSTGTDAFLLVADASTLEPTGFGQLFGDHADKADWGVSVADHPSGFVVAGLSASGFDGTADPKDLYLVGTDGSGKTTCSTSWSPSKYEMTVPASRVVPRPEELLVEVSRKVGTERPTTGVQYCR
jgi:hypothetical protein